MLFIPTQFTLYYLFGIYILSLIRLSTKPTIVIMKLKSLIPTTILVTALSTSAATVSINFLGGRGSSGTDDGPLVTGSAGIESVGNWNNATGNWGFNGGPSSLASLVDSAGLTTTASVSYSAYNTWDDQAGDGNGSDLDMMSGFLDNMQILSGAITLSNIPYAQYDVYVYFNRTAETFLGVTADDGTNTNDYYARHDGTTFSGSYTTSQDTDVSDGWTEANAFLFSNYTGSTLTLDSAPWTGGGSQPNNYKMIVHGIQIVEVVPEPSTAFLITLSGLALTTRRKR